MLKVETMSEVRIRHFYDILIEESLLKKGTKNGGNNQYLKIQFTDYDKNYLLKACEFNL